MPQTLLRTSQSEATTDSDIVLLDNTQGDVSTLKHGFIPKLINDARKFFNGIGGYAFVKDSDLSLSDIMSNDVSVARHGFIPKLPSDSAKFFNGAGAYVVPPVPTFVSGYTLHVASSLGTPANTYTLYVGVSPIFNMNGAINGCQMVIPKSGIIKAATLAMYCNAPGSAEAITTSLRLNNIANTLIAQIANTANTRYFTNTSMSLAVVAGDTLSFAVQFPTWVTLPSGLQCSGYIYVEQ